MIKPGYLCFALFALIASCLHAQQAPVASPGTVSLAEIRIRDPFILPDSAQRIYYLFGTNYPDAAPGKGGFDVYTSRDLISWQGPEAVYRPASGHLGMEKFLGSGMPHLPGKILSFRHDVGGGRFAARHYDSAGRAAGRTLP